MRQRIVIAICLALNPKLLIMDEPTTALDVVVQREILQRIHKLRQELGFSVLFITHDLALMVQVSDRIGIMLEGELVEVSPPQAIYRSPQHDLHAQALGLDAAAHRAACRPAGCWRPRREPVADAADPGRRASWARCSAASATWRRCRCRFPLHPGRTLALVGESGSGKTTCARSCANDAGNCRPVLFHGRT